MSWSISKSGTKDEVKKYLDEEAPKGIAHVTGVERTLADSLLGTARAAVEANNDPHYNIQFSAYGSCNFDNGNQTTQTLSLRIDLLTP